jgi:predicted dehydrogenase
MTAYTYQLIKEMISIDIANGTKCISPAEDGVEIMRIIDAIYESAKTGREIMLK